MAISFHTVLNSASTIAILTQMRFITNTSRYILTKSCEGRVIVTTQIGCTTNRNNKMNDKELANISVININRPNQYSRSICTPFEKASE